MCLRKNKLLGTGRFYLDESRKLYFGAELVNKILYLIGPRNGISLYNTAYYLLKMTPSPSVQDP